MIAQTIFILFTLKNILSTILTITEDKWTFFLKVVKNTSVWFFTKKIIFSELLKRPWTQKSVF